MTVRITGVAHVEMIAVLRNLRRVNERTFSPEGDSFSIGGELADLAVSSKIISSRVTSLPS